MGLFMKKAMTKSLEMIVIIIVVLAVIVTVLTFFTGILWRVKPMTDWKATCYQQAAATCGLTSKMPPTWEQSFRYTDSGSERTGSCAGLYPACKCEKNELKGCDN